MRIAVVGGGPAGLAFAAFARRTARAHQVTVWERRHGEDTYGFGVVLPPAALDTLEQGDPCLADGLRPHLADLSRVTVHRHGRSHTLRGPALGAVDRRTLLGLLRGRCADLGVRLRYGELAPPAASLTTGYDLVVAADGARSAVRGELAAHFGTGVDRLAPHYTWLGAQRAFDGLTFLVADCPHGLVTAHAYPYAPGRSTFLVEAAHRPDTAEVERLFRRELEGTRLLENRSRWQRFPLVRNDRWSHGNVVLLGDAAHTAHYSVGSGTRLALDDALALITAVRDAPSVPAALKAYEVARRPVVEHTQWMGRASAAWFAGLGDAPDTSPERFVTDLLTRGGRISLADLAADGAGRVPAGTVGNRS
ncbi:FAD-dependent monooxygenase [Streptomyces sp. JJ66]|uniref:FAD-dependent monooxygenase n=1 Tax=Streptomyces sp. JJ66 TaxID=2803843 RepID=UPI001C57327F|nr:FAD-dependent monooxygenase [Streptomyces sp. JJ66]MBW1600588.1 FAD-dependent monooxygenase [Streptomyces sp. JJ66]